MAAVLQQLREDSAVFADLARPAERGDVVLLDSVRVDANGRRMSGTRAKNRRIELGAAGVAPELDNGLLGAEAGQERTIEIQYPADYPAEELAGKSARYLVSVRKIQEKKLRDLDDNLAKEVFGLPVARGTSLARAPEPRRGGARAGPAGAGLGGLRPSSSDAIPSTCPAG